MEKTSHHAATVRNDRRTASAAPESPNVARRKGHRHVHREEQAAADVAEGVAEGGDLVVSVGGLTDTMRAS